jgi:hypothetical protein
MITLNMLTLLFKQGTLTEGKVSVSKNVIVKASFVQMQKVSMEQRAL